MMMWKQSLKDESKSKPCQLQRKGSIRGLPHLVEIWQLLVWCCILGQGHCALVAKKRPLHVTTSYSETTE